MQTINRLIELNIEIEGVLRVLEARDNASIRQLLDKKFKEFAGLFESICRTETATEQESTSAPEIVNGVQSPDIDKQPEQQAEADVIVVDDDAAQNAMLAENEKIAVDDAIADVTRLMETPDEIAEIDTVVIDDGSAPTDVTEGFEIAENGEIVTVDDTPEALDEQPVIVVETADEPPVAETLEEHTLTPPAEKADTQDSESPKKPSIPKTQPMPSLFDDVMTPDASKDDIRVDELLTRREARDLKRAFTLNDKFRFRRELFGNNDSMFADTLNAIMAMKSIDEATEYLYEDLGWDPDNEDVKDFVTIVSKHFAEI